MCLMTVLFACWELFQCPNVVTNFQQSRLKGYAASPGRLGVAARGVLRIVRLGLPPS